MLRFTPVLLLALFLLSACGMQRDFHRRQYRPGYYSESRDQSTQGENIPARETATLPAKTARASSFETPVHTKQVQPVRQDDKRNADFSTRSHEEKQQRVSAPARIEKTTTQKKSLPDPVTSPGEQTPAGDQPGNEPMSGDFYGTFFTILVIGMIAGGIYLIVAGSVALGIILICLPVIAIVILAIVIGRAMDKAHREMHRACNDSMSGCARGCHGF